MSEGLVIDGISRTFLTENGAVVPALEGLWRRAKEET